MSASIKSILFVESLIKYFEVIYFKFPLAYIVFFSFIKIFLNDLSFFFLK